MAEARSLEEIKKEFSSEAAAERWLLSFIWPNGVACPRCGGKSVNHCKSLTMPYRCRSCRHSFSWRSNTFMIHSRLSLQQWAIAISWCVDCRMKKVSSLRLSKAIGVTQKTAWYMIDRIRRSFFDVACGRGPS